jgi:hypothetical protein
VVKKKPPDGYKYVNYATSQVYLEQGWYSKDQVEQMLVYFTMQEKALKESMRIPDGT